MSARDELLELYAEWYRWTELEGSGLRQTDWPVVLRCQEAKQALQPRIVEATKAAEAEAALLRTTHEVRNDVRTTLQQLIALEQENQQILNAARERATNRTAELSTSVHTLKRIHRSYGPVATAHWQSYS